MAKADKEDIDRVTAFFVMLEEAIEYGTFTLENPDEEEVSEDVDAERIVELIRGAWGERGPGVGPSWRRVVMGCAVLIDNCCDPDADTLEWRPDLRAFLESQPEVLHSERERSDHHIILPRKIAGRIDIFPAFA
jgi:hypothetical protein